VLHICTYIVLAVFSYSVRIVSGNDQHETILRMEEKLHVFLTLALCIQMLYCSKFLAARKLLSVNIFICVRWVLLSGP